MWGKDHRHESGNRGRYCNSLRRNDSIHCEQTTFSLQDQLTKQNKTRAWFAGADVAMAPTCSARYLSVRTLCTRALAKPPSFPLIFLNLFKEKQQLDQLNQCALLSGINSLCANQPVLEQGIFLVLCHAIGLSTPAPLFAQSTYFRKARVITVPSLVGSSVSDI